MPLETGERPWSASLPLASAKGMAMPGGTGRGSFTATAFRSRDVLKDDLGLAGRREAGISYPAEGAALPAGEAGFPGDQRGSPPLPPRRPCAPPTVLAALSDPPAPGWSAADGARACGPPSPSSAAPRRGYGLGRESRDAGR